MGLFIYIEFFWDSLGLNKEKIMNLYMVHVGYYDKNIGDGIYEILLNYFVAAASVKDAKKKTKSLEKFKKKPMNIDGIKEISNVGGNKVTLKESPEFDEGVIFNNDKLKD